MSYLRNTFFCFLTELSSRTIYFISHCKLRFIRLKSLRRHLSSVKNLISNYLYITKKDRNESLKELTGKKSASIDSIGNEIISTFKVIISMNGTYMDF